MVQWQDEQPLPPMQMNVTLNVEREFNVKEGPEVVRRLSKKARAELQSAGERVLEYLDSGPDAVTAFAADPMTVLREIAPDSESLLHELAALQSLSDEPVPLAPPVELISMKVQLTDPRKEG